jgi:hypothetical protein
VPDSVEEVFMARIERLPDGAKSVLQMGAVIGREFRWEVLQAVTGLAEQELLAHLSALTDAELVYVRGLPPQTTYLFKHAFTQATAYRSLLTPRRRDIHRRVVLALEALFSETPLVRAIGTSPTPYLLASTLWPRMCATFSPRPPVPIAPRLQRMPCATGCCLPLDHLSFRLHNISGRLIYRHYKRCGRGGLCGRRGRGPPDGPRPRCHSTR